MGAHHDCPADERRSSPGSVGPSWATDGALGRRPTARAGGGPDGPACRRRSRRSPPLRNRSSRSALGTGQRWTGSTGLGRRSPLADRQPTAGAIASAASAGRRPGRGRPDLDERRRSCEVVRRIQRRRHRARARGSQRRRSDDGRDRGPRRVVAVGNYVGVQYGPRRANLDRRLSCGGRATPGARSGRNAAVTRGGLSLRGRQRRRADNYIPTIWLTAEP